MKIGENHYSEMLLAGGDKVHMYPVLGILIKLHGADFMLAPHPQRSWWVCKASQKFDWAYDPQMNSDPKSS
jgi:hypothetical protein